MGKLTINGRQCDLDSIMYGVELQVIFYILFSRRKLTSDEFKQAKKELLPQFSSERAKNTLNELNKDQQTICSSICHSAYIAMQKQCLQYLEDTSTAPIASVMWPEDLAGREQEAIFCLQDESILVSHPSPIRWLGTTSLMQCIALYIYNEKTSLLLHLSPPVIAFGCNSVFVRKYITENLPVTAYNVMILGEEPEHNNPLIMSLYSLALLAQKGYEFTITYQATLNRNISPWQMSLSKCSPCDRELMRMTIYTILREKIILAYKTLYPRESLEPLYTALSMPYTEVLTDASFSVPPMFISYLLSISMVAQQHTATITENLQSLFDSGLLAKDVFIALAQATLHSKNTLEIYRPTAESLLLPKYYAFMTDCKTKQVSLLSPQTLGIARSLRNRLFTELPPLDPVQHIRVENGRCIFLPLRTMSPYWADPSTRTSVLEMSRTADDPLQIPEKTIMQHLPRGLLDPKSLHDENIARQIFEFCLYLNTAASNAQPDLLKAVLFSHHASSTSPATHLELFILFSLVYLLENLIGAGNATIEVHRRNAPDSKICDAMITGTPVAEEEASKKLSAAEITHYRISGTKNTHCIYIENIPNASTMRFFSLLRASIATTDEPVQPKASTIFLGID